MNFSRLGRMLVESAGEQSPTLHVSTDSLVGRGLKPLDKTPTGAKSPEADASARQYSHLDLSPPKEVQRAAKKGVELRKKREALKRSGEIGASESLGGTDIGVARAVQLMSGKQITPAAIRRMSNYFTRHASDADAEGFGDDAMPSAGYVAWLLWGGDPARAWVKEKIRTMDNSDAVVEAAPVGSPRQIKARTIRGQGKAIADIYTENDVVLTVKLNLSDLRDLLRGKEVEIMAKDAVKEPSRSNVYKLNLSYSPKGPLA
jgi:ribosomal protein L25 (general stress protein Ctc)